MSAGNAGPWISDAELCAFLDGEIAGDRRAEIGHQLAHHPEANARLANWRRQTETIRAAYEQVAHQPLPDFLIAPLPKHKVAPLHPAAPLPHACVRTSDVARAEPPLAAAPVIWRRMSFNWRTVALACLAAAALLGFIASSLLHGLERPQMQAAAMAETPASGLMRRALEAHLSFVDVEALRLDATGSRQAEALAAQTGLGLRMPETPPALQTIGLRLLPGEREMAGLLLLEARSAVRLGLYVSRHVSRHDGPATQSMMVRETAGLTSALFVSDDVAYVLTGRIARPLLLDLASTMRDSLRQSR